MIARRLIAVALVVAAGCGTGTAGDDGTCPDLAGSAAPTGSASAAAVAAVLAENCAVGGCHLAAPGAGNLWLERGSNAWVDHVVDVPAEEAPSLDLVTPGMPERSWLVLKLYGEFCGAACSGEGCGGQMPFGGSLADADRDTIVAWVAAGAAM
jgi:hypothetical protein